MIDKDLFGGAQKRVADAPPNTSFTKRRGPLRRFFHEHPSLTDASVSLSYYVLTAFALLARVEPIAWYSIVLPAVVGLILFLRRKAPVWVTLVLAVIELTQIIDIQHTLQPGLSLMFALYAVGSQRGQRVAFLCFASVSIPIVTALLLVAPARLESGTGAEISWSAWATSVALLIVLYLVFTGIGVSVWRDRLHENEVRQWVEDNTELTQIHERARIAREMHDVVAHSLAVMIALSDGARAAMRSSPERADHALLKLSETGRAAQADMQRVLGVLGQTANETKLDRKPQSTEQDLPELLAGFTAAGLPLALSTSGPPMPQEPSFGLTVYRIIQESLTNALRYGREMTRVEVGILHNHPVVEITVDNDGHAAPEAEQGLGSGRGLAGLRERVAQYEGSLVAGKRDTGGWRVKAVLGCPDGDAAESMVETGIKW